ncbi:MAG: penicillin-binding transpeptidase domain-containing protein, partial [Myxococcota bacterium]|nr:penicillin-binding transpeptidase domain-containing protein [Myxococcota bacterium]
TWIYPGDEIWAGHLPLEVDGEATESGTRVVLQLVKGHATEDGDRRWMGLDLPHWSLGEPTEPAAGWLASWRSAVTSGERWSFWSRESQFHVPFMPLAEFQLPDVRTEYEQEQILQAFIDHELLCYDNEARSLWWNLDTGVGCDRQSPVPAPPAKLYRRAEEWAYLPGIQAFLARETRRLSSLPEQTPGPGSLAFVYDWVYRVPTEGPSAGSLDTRDLQPFPERLLGVRTDSTRTRPSTRSAQSVRSGHCRMARSSRFARHAPVSVAQGSTSAYLEALHDHGRIQAGMRFLLTGTRVSDDAPAGTLCIEPGKVTNNVGRGASTLSLGSLVVSSEGSTLQWSAEPRATPKTGTCAMFTGGAGKLTVEAVTGTIQVHDRWLGQIIEVTEGRSHTASHGSRIELSGLQLRVVAPSAPDRAAFSTLTETGSVDRWYPFGSDLSPVLGYGAYSGGLEGSGEDTLWEHARERWEETCSPQEDPEQWAQEQGIELTLLGDLQRILASELASVTASCSTGDQTCPRRAGGEQGWGEATTASAVLIDSITGDLLAVANAPSFEPNDDDQVSRFLDDVRRHGDGGSVGRTLQNRAFLRARHAGSTYKLATAYALAREGLLDETSGSSFPAQCSDWGGTDQGTFTVYQPSEAEPPDPWTLQPARRGEALAPGTPTISSDCETNSSVDLNAGRGFLAAFQYSRNPYFAVAPLALLPGSGISYGRAVHRSRQTRWTGSNPLRLGGREAPGLWQWTDHHLGATLDPAFDPGQDLKNLSTNAFLRTLVELGHRYFYRAYGGRGLSTQGFDGVGDTSWPTSQVDAGGEASRRWLPGLRVGTGYRYPDIRGPELYSIDGRGTLDWSDLSFNRDGRRTGGDLLCPHSTSHVNNDGNHVTHCEPLGRELLREYWKQAYGFGGVQASALSLAVMTTPVVRTHANAVAPNLVRTPTQPGSTGDRAMTTSSILGTRSREVQDRQSLLQEAMRSVIQSGTGRNFFNGTYGDVDSRALRARLGGKTGTYDVGLLQPAHSDMTPETQSALDRLWRHACGVREATGGGQEWLDRADLARLSAEAETLGADIPLQTSLAQLWANPERGPRGFAGSAQSCDTLNPGRARTAQSWTEQWPQEVDEGEASAWTCDLGDGEPYRCSWLDLLVETFAPAGTESTNRAGSSMLVVVLGEAGRD